LILRISRIYTEQALEPDSELLLQDGQAHYLSRVLRVKSGQAVVLFNGDGGDYSGEIRWVEKTKLLVRINGRVPSRTEPPLNITLVQAITRGERMDQILQKSTELGATAFQPLLSRRVEVRLRPTQLEKRMQHWRNVVISACEQCGRSVIPRVSEPLKLDQWLDQKSRSQRLLLDPESEIPLTQVKIKCRVELVIGPEGGFSTDERELMRQQQVQLVSLGPRILRTETAGPAAVSVLQALAGDFG
jgi:16S rRNA (uracil1498-N3)-methyltransferase